MNDSQEKSTISLTFSDVSPDIRVNVPYYKEPVVRNEKIPVPYGEQNLFPNELLELIQQSVSAQSILTGTKQIISNYDIVQNFQLPCAPFINNDHQSLIDLITNLAHDYLVFGAFAIQVSWNKLNQISELIHIPFEMIRMNVTKEKIFFNRFWSKYSTNSVVYNRFSLNRKEDEFSQIYVYTNNGYRSTYGMSLFSGVLNDLASEVSASQYIKNSLDSGLSSRFIIDLPNSANLDDDQKADIEQAIKDKFCGSANAGSFMMYFNNSNDELKITQIADDNSHERFKAIADYTRQNIFMALHATPNLFGSPTATTGFSSQEYQDAYNLFYKMTVAPCLNTITEAFNTIFNTDKAIEYVTESKAQDDLINEDDETIEKNNSEIKPLA